MTKILTNNQYYHQIADVIREQNGTSNTYKPAQMVSALKDLFYEEVEGVPPITFQGIGENLLDYKIDGAVGGVGDRTSNLVDKTKFVYGYRLNNMGTLYTAPSEQNLFAVSEFIEVNSGEQYIISQRDATRGYARRISFYQSKNENSWLSNNDDSDLIFTVPNTATYLKFTTLQNYIDSIMLIRGTSLPTTYEPYGYKVPVVINGKNLFDEENAVNTDYYITGTGQEAVGANGDKFLKSHIYVNPSTQYTFKWSQTIMGSANNTPYIRISEYTSNNTFIQRLLCQCSAQSQNNYTFTTSNNTLYIDIIIDSETSTRGQHLIEIMLVKGATAPDTYEEYTATTTNIYLDEPISENESISLSDTNTNIPTIRGTNVLTVDTTVQPSNVYVQARKNSDLIALDMSNIKLATSTFTTLPSLIANADWSNVTDAAGMFNLCSSLTTVPELDLSSATNLTQMFNYCIDLTTLGGFKNLGQAYLTSKSSNYSEYKLNLSSCTQLTHDSLMNVINNLYDIATKGCNTQELILGSTNLSKLTAEEIAIATNKGWSVS